MAFKIFTIPILNGASAEEDLNTFVSTHKILYVHRQLIDDGVNSVWSFCVDYAEHGSGAGAASKAAGQRSRTDYREVLSADDFAIFAKLRDLRKEISQKEGIPVYAIFNNEQLAQMVQKKVRNKKELEAITGVGDARTGKYGTRFLELLTHLWSSTGEKDRKSV